MKDLVRARIIKNISNLYSVDLDGVRIDLKPRGKLRKDRAPLVGDFVWFDPDEKIIEKIEKRANQMLRPAVANVDQAILLTSLIDPDFSQSLLDRQIFLAALCQIEPVLLFTKWDRLNDRQRREMAKKMKAYEKMGYKVFVSYPGSNDYFFKEALKGKMAVLCGQSGAGKSSFLNRLSPWLELKTQDTSQALGRGKHTTRNSELYEIEGLYLADTPGFSSLDFSRYANEIESLDQKLKAFEPYLGKCQYRDCRHDKEPGCAIKEAVKNHLIDPQFYQDYLALIREAKENRTY